MAAILNNLVLIRNPRTASTALMEEFLARGGRKFGIHKSADEVVRRLGPDMIYFSVIRNHWDRIYSLYRHFNTDYGPGSGKAMQRANFGLNLHQIFQLYQRIRISLLQDDYVGHDDVTVLRFEHLQDDFDEFMMSNNLEPFVIPRRNASDRQPGYREFFTPFLQTMVREKLARDFAKYDYEF